MEMHNHDHGAADQEAQDREAQEQAFRDQQQRQGRRAQWFGGGTPPIRSHADATGSPAARNGSLAWFYRILDVEYGVDMAVRDALRVKTPASATMGLIINGLLALFFAGVWFRYDLWSTITVFNPMKLNILTVVPEDWGTIKTLLGYLLGVAVAFLTTLIQWAYPRFAQEHEAATWGLAFASIFDLATDYYDVNSDFPALSRGFIDMMGQQSHQMWVWAALGCFVAGFFLARNRSFLWILALIAVACLIWPTNTVWTNVITFVGTIFCSFVVQSLLVIHVAKCFALVGRQREMLAVGV